MVSKIMIGVAIFFATTGGLMMAIGVRSGDSTAIIYSAITITGAICISISAWSVANSEKAIKEIKSMDSGNRN